MCKLRKALYGLKQTPRAWFHKLYTSLIDMEFQNSRANSSLFVKGRHANIIIVLVYVDDILITGVQPVLVEKLILDLNLKFALIDLGLLLYILGVEVSYTHTSLHLSQTKYVVDLLDTFGLLDIKSVAIPCVLVRC